VILDRHGLRIELPRGWSGRIYAREGGIATLHAGSFPLVLGDKSTFGQKSTGAMPVEGAFLALTEYLTGQGLEPGSGLFADHRIPRPLDPARLSKHCLAHPKPGQAGLQHFFTTSGRPFCLYAVLAGGGPDRRHHLAALNHVLRSLRITARAVRP